jgi:hypothetical protein
MAIIINKISEQLAKTGYENRTKKARDWLRKKAGEVRTPGRKPLLADESRKAKRITPGKMFFYMYDPKTKDTLPYYDKFPLVFPIELYPDGFLGMNIHYIRPKQRIALLDKLYETLNNERFDDTTKMRVSYNLLNGAARFKEYAPCLKRYLASHIRSNVIEIESSEWEIAASLPFEQFVGATTTKVHRDSQELINGI